MSHNYRCCLNILTLTTILGLGACTTTHDFTMAAYEPVEEPKYPAIDVFQLQPSQEFRKACQEFDAKSALSHCTLNRIDFFKVADALSRTGYFENVTLASREQPYSIAMSVASYDSETAGEIGQAALAGATLLLLPVSTNAALKVNGVVMWHSEPLHEFNLELPFTLHGSWATMNADVDGGLADSIASHIVENLEGLEVFGPRLLHSTLGSSDYTHELVAPEHIDKFSQSDATLLHNPFDGAGLRYQHEEYENGWVDVYVYPIRSWQYEDPANLQTEVEAIRRDLALVEKEGMLSNLKLADDISPVTDTTADLPGITFSADYDLPEQKGLSSRTFVFLKADKFIKVRATFGQFTPALEEVGHFASAIARDIKIPEESLFMARLRKQWRDQGNL